MAELRFDRAVLLIGITVGLNMAVAALSRWSRAQLRLNTTPEPG
jgi:hypothetical protein